MFSKNFWYIGILTLLVVAMEIFAVLFLARHKWLSRIVLWLAALYIFVTQIVDISRSGKFFWAFSTVAYWMFVVGVAVPWRPLKSICATFALIAGCVYVAGFLLYPEMMTHGGQFGLGYMSGFVIHDLLILGALLMYTQFQVKKIDAAFIGGCIAVVVTMTELGVYVFHWQNVNAFLRGVIEGTVLKQEFFPEMRLTFWWYILWYGVILAALWGAWKAIRLINRGLLKYHNVMPGKAVW